MLGNNRLWTSHASMSWEAEALTALLLGWLSKDVNREKISLEHRNGREKKNINMRMNETIYFTVHHPCLSGMRQKHHYC